MGRDKVLPAALALVVLMGLLATGLEWFSQRTPPPVDTATSLLRGGGEGFARVTGPRHLRFPADHGAHPDYRNEWWYVTGNLRDADGRAYGFELTFFRIALAADRAPRPSHFATRQVWMAHFAVTDIAGKRHRFAVRFERGADGLAGAHANPPTVWLDDWSMRAEQHGALFPLRLTARADGMAIALRLTNDRPRVLQGKRGYSRKSAQPGNASQYYSYTRIQSRGTVAIGDGTPRTVSGTAWLDREWSSSALGPKQTGWDWFALQLDDGRDLMVYRLRRRDGSTDPFSAGVVVGPEGVRRRLDAGDFSLEPLEEWRSPATGIRYPVDWRLRVPTAGLDLRVTARVASQEMGTRFRYWEGAVRVNAHDPAPKGVGYLEMTGYGPERASRGIR